MTDPANDDREPDFAAAASVHDIDYWREHPDVLSVELVDLDDDPADPSIGLAFYLRDDEPDVVETDFADIRSQKPSRPPDIELSGEGLMDDDFWLRSPRLEFVQMMQEPPDEAVPDGWWMVQLWLKTVVN
ncbi:hypothetical protein [Phenylobacterium koreense]|uniref:Uncharacterized protein n=1 Tax=Phenylobacterium koreense TaxID=266125 RepID=A0ABV2EHU5_9CAUL